MQRFWWPGHELQLLRELQRQQHSTQFCDTLLQTEDISIPTHACVLAALSPYFSEKLSASPPPPSGQRRQLQLHNMKAKTLVKLVGLLYSGVLEVKEVVEKDDVLEAAHTFGIADLVEGQKYVEVKEGVIGGDCKGLGICKENDRDLHKSLKMQDAQVQVEMLGRRDKTAGFGKKSCASVGTQTVTEKSVENLSNTKPPTSETESPGGQSFNLSFSVEPQISTSVEPYVSTPRPAIRSDEESILTQSSNPVSTTTFSSDAVTFPVNSDSSFAHEDSACHESSQSGDSMQVSAKEGTGVTDGTNSRGGEETRERSEKEGVCARAELTNLAERKQMHHMVETTQISVKVKLRRRRSEGEVWEVVSMQDTDETFSVLASLKQDCSTLKKPQTDAKKLPPPPSTDLSHKPEVLNPQPAASSSSTQFTQPLSGVSFTPNRTDEPEAAPLSQPHGSVEESDEQIGKLLEDIMMGLNILPDLERGCRKSDTAPSVCHDPGTENGTDQSQLHSAGQCNFYQSDESTNTSIHCFAAQHRPASLSLSAPPPDVLLQQQHSAWFDSSDGSLGQSSSITCQEKLHYPQFQQPPSQEDQHILQFVPLSNRNGTHLDQTFPLPCMDDFRLPPCLSPLQSVTTQQLHLNSSSNDLQQQQQPWGQRRPWLTESPGSLTFPLSTASQSRWSKQYQGHMDQNPKAVGACVETHPVNTAEKGRTSEADLQFYSKEIQEALKCKQDDPAGGAAAPKRTRKRIAGRGKDGTINKIKGPEQARIRTRSFVKKETSSSTITGNTAHLIPLIHRATIMNTQGVLFPKRTCGRPPKKSPEDSVPVDEDGELEMGKEEKQTSRGCEKRKRNTSEVETKSAVTAASTKEAESKDDTTKLWSPKRPKMVSLKDFQKLIQRQHPTNTSKSNGSQVTDETAGGDEGEAHRDSTKGTEEEEERAETEEDHVIFSLDENHNQLLDKHREDSNSSANDNSGSSFDAMEEEEVNLSTQSETPTKNKDEGGADSHQVAVSNTHLPQESNTALDHNLNPPVSGADDISGTSGCVQEEGDEEEVDILIYSPDKDPQGQTCECGLNSMDVIADEEEEEVNDVDVTGDEAE